jgi:two-component system sensor histidine kinase TctE
MARCGERSCRALTTRFEAGDEVVLLTVADLLPTAEPVARYGLLSTLLSDFVQLDLTLVLVWIGIQFGLRPVLRLRDEIAARSPNDLRAINAESVPRELAPIVITLNRLFALLRYSVEAQQQFIANTAHQVRTPITGIQAQLNLLVAEPAAEPVKARLLMLQDGVRQLAHAANQLLSLARADPSLQIAARRQPVELQRLVGEVATRFFDRALECGIDLGVDLKPSTLLADPALIDDLCANLVDNALKYTPAGGSVTVSTGEAAGRPFLVVEDSGPGIPVTERQRVRQRFYRLPHAPGHGSGLGLAIVDEIATLYDATVSIDTGAAGRGTRVTVEFANPGWGSRAS